MTTISRLYFFSTLFLVFVLEGLGIDSERNVVYLLILLLPFALIFFGAISQRSLVKDFVFPQKITIIFTLFSLCSLVSTFFSVNKQRAFEYFLLYIALFLLFVFSYNHKKTLKMIIFALILALTIVFALYSLLLRYTPFNIVLPHPTSGYQFVYSTFGSHNHIGELLTISMTLFFYLFLAERRWYYLLFTLLLFPTFLLSFSRSAYTALLTGVSSMLARSMNPFYKLPIMLCLFGVTIFLLAASPETSTYPLLTDFQNNLSRYGNLKEKSPISTRTAYLQQAFQSVQKHPLWGVGGNNFVYASYLSGAKTQNISSSTHNIFIDTLVEQGIPTTLLLVGMFCYMALGILQGRKSPDTLAHAYIFVLLAMFITFQVDYTHRIFSFIALFFIIAGLVYEEPRSFPGKYLVIYLSFALFLIIQSSILSRFLVSQQLYTPAFYLYPLNEETYYPLIQEEFSKRQYDQGKNHLRIYNSLFPLHESLPDISGRN